MYFNGFQASSPGPRKTASMNGFYIISVPVLVPVPISETASMNNTISVGDYIWTETIGMSLPRHRGFSDPSHTTSYKTF